MDLLEILCASQGFFTRSQAKDAGYDDKAIAAAYRSKEWHRIRRGYYVFGDRWRTMDAVERHRVRSAAVLHSLGDAVALSHVSASVAHGVDIWGIPLDRVHVTRLDGGAGRIEGDVVHHEGFCVDGDVVELDGHLVMKPERAAIEAVARVDSDVALAHFDNMLHRGKCDADTLKRQFDLMCRWPHTQHLHIPVRMADPRAASIGESRGRSTCWRHSLPLPELQHEVRAADGTLLGTCDWWWPEQGLLGEFDGQVKYGRLLLPGQNPGEVVFAEKQREDLIREATGLPMIRVVWSDYDRPRVLVARLERLLRRAG